MIHIDLAGESPKKAWLKKAKALTANLMQLKGDAARQRFIDDHRGLWRELEPWLRDLSHGKCWYSEARDCASYWHVDHLRPRGKVKDLRGKVSKGYWWLAFDWRNYRLSGSAINVPKSTKFPVREGTPRLTGPHQDEADESPYLLDPANPVDPGLLSFDERGKAVPGDPDGKWNRRRAEVTISIMNLNYDPLARARQVCWKRCDQLASRAVNLMTELQRRASQSKEARLQEVMHQLCEMAEATSEFSAVAVTCVESQGIKWLTRQVLHR